MEEGLPEALVALLQSASHMLEASNSASQATELAAQGLQPQSEWLLDLAAHLAQQVG